MLGELDARRLKLASIYVDTSLDPAKRPYPAGLATAIAQLRGRDTQIWITVSGGKPSAEDLDDRAVAMIREIAGMAQRAGLRVALYPHQTCYVERVGDAIRLVKKVGRPNVGLCFNLCHFLKCDDETQVRARLIEALPYLLCVNINGADSGQRGSPGWKRLIQTLDRGNFNVAQVLATLKELGYRGPIGLQCFGIDGDSRDNLTRSMAAWRGRCAASPPRGSAVAPPPKGTVPILLIQKSGQSPAKPSAPWAFYAFDNGTGGPSVPFDQQAAMLAELGYDGLAYAGRLPLSRLGEMLAALDAHGLKMFNVYIGLNADPAKPPYDPLLKSVVEQLKGRETQIWVPIVGGHPRAQDQDDRIVRILREIADLCNRSGIKVAIYPHINWYAERYEDAIRLAKKADRKNLGVVFNLSHFMIRDREELLEQRLPEGGAYLLGVSINGADHGYRYSKDWKHLILSLDRGDYDVARVLVTLDQMGYHGPIGLQCHDMTGDPRDNLAHSMAGWRKLVVRAAERTR